jgi:hypothetical protein
MRLIDQIFYSYLDDYSINSYHLAASFRFRRIFILNLVGVSGLLSLSP